ncbi:MAG: hypothetical protein WA364_02600 [Candidatus Nitrosopolaris sp.]
MESYHRRLGVYLWEISNWTRLLTFQEYRFNRDILDLINHYYDNQLVTDYSVQDIDISIGPDKLRYEMFVKAYNETREHDGINGLTPSEMFLQRLIKSDTYTKKRQESVTHVGKQNYYLSL